MDLQFFAFNASTVLQLCCDIANAEDIVNSMHAVCAFNGHVSNFRRLHPPICKATRVRVQECNVLSGLIYAPDNPRDLQLLHTINKIT